MANEDRRLCSQVCFARYVEDSKTNKHEYIKKKPKNSASVFKKQIYTRKKQGGFFFLYPPASLCSLRTSITLHLSDKSSHCPPGSPLPLGLSPFASAHNNPLPCPAKCFGRRRKIRHRVALAESSLLSAVSVQEAPNSRVQCSEVESGELRC